MAMTRHHSSVLYRENLKTDRLYVDTSDESSLFTPDGEGVIFYDTIAEGQEQTGLTTLHYVDKVDLDHLEDPDFDDTPFQ